MHPEDDDICGQNPEQLPDFAKWIKQATPDKQPLAHIRGEKITVRSHQGPEIPLEYQISQYHKLLDFRKQNMTDGIYPIIPNSLCPEEAIFSDILKPVRVIQASSIEEGIKLCREGYNQAASRCTVDELEKHIKKCFPESYFPCAWSDNSQGVNKQYWIEHEDMWFIGREVYDRQGNLLSETLAKKDAYVENHIDLEKNIETSYNKDGFLDSFVRLHGCKQTDSFRFDEQGNLTSCKCENPLSDADCCARVEEYVKVGKPLRYCDLYPQDKDFCKI